MKTITTAELQQILAAQPSAPLIDVRTPAEFAEVHSTGAQYSAGRIEPRRVAAPQRPARLPRLPHRPPLGDGCGTICPRWIHATRRRCRRHARVVQGQPSGHPRVDNDTRLIN